MASISQAGRKATLKSNTNLPAPTTAVRDSPCPLLGAEFLLLSPKVIIFILVVLVHNAVLARQVERW